MNGRALLLSALREVTARPDCCAGAKAEADAARRAKAAIFMVIGAIYLLRMKEGGEQKGQRQEGGTELLLVAASPHWLVDTSRHARGHGCCSVVTSQRSRAFSSSSKDVCPSLLRNTEFRGSSTADRQTICANSSS